MWLQWSIPQEKPSPGKWQKREDMKIKVLEVAALAKEREGTMLLAPSISTGDWLPRVLPDRPNKTHRSMIVSTVPIS